LVINVRSNQRSRLVVSPTHSHLRSSSSIRKIPLNSIVSIDRWRFKTVGVEVSLVSGLRKEAVNKIFDIKRYTPYPVRPRALIVVSLEFGRKSEKKRRGFSKGLPYHKLERIIVII
jgi:hypothetical protein